MSAIDDPESEILSEFAAQAVKAMQRGRQEEFDRVRFVAPKVLSFDEDAIVAAGQGSLISEELSPEIVFSAWDCARFRPRYQADSTTGRSPDQQAREVGDTPVIGRVSDSWNRFWFTPWSTKLTILPRLAVCLVAAFWMLSFLPGLDAWFSEQGWLPRSLAASLINVDQTPTWQQWSPLWWTDSTVVYFAWLLVGNGHRAVGCLRESADASV